MRSAVLGQAMSINKVLGIGLDKCYFHVHGVDKNGILITRKKKYYTSIHNKISLCAPYDSYALAIEVHHNQSGVDNEKKGRCLNYPKSS